MKNKLFPTLALGIICLVVVLVLAAVNTITAPLIEKAQAEKVQKALAEVMPEGVNFTEIEVDGLPDEVTKVYSEDGGGYVFRTAHSSFDFKRNYACTNQLFYVFAHG